MNTIRILPEKVASQIAAGEVIDRPASVVRELIDNSIDSGADRIVISIERGGKGLIKVADNGVGMSRDDLLLCVERHATSKIETAADLFLIKSLGFRGEALPSIASVSRMHIISRLHDQLSGQALKIAGGKLLAIEETGTPAGTIVEVKDLFFNVPARRKFLRAPKTETDHIIDIFSRIALPFSDIDFKIIIAGKTHMHFPSSEKPLIRLTALLGKNVVKAIINKKKENDELTIQAYLAPPDFARTRGDRLFVYVNGRNIRDRLLTRAIMEGYGKRLMKGSYPQVVIFIEIDPSKVDVNIHPTKQEVRFYDSRAVFQAIVAAIEDALGKSFYAGIGEEHESEVWNINQQRGLTAVSEQNLNYSFSDQGITTFPAVENNGARTIVREYPRIIGQLNNSYILCQVADGFLMVDQHAAHERILYEKLKKCVEDSKLEVQFLLVPYKLELSMKEKRILLSKGAKLTRFGIDLDHFGGNTFLLRSAPSILKNLEWDSFISEIISRLEEGEPEDDRQLDKIFATMACHGAIRAGDRMTIDEMDSLLRQLEQTDLPANCPHGRPVSIHFTYHEIEKMFKRIV